MTVSVFQSRNLAGTHVTRYVHTYVVYRHAEYPFVGKVKPNTLLKQAQAMAYHLTMNPRKNSAAEDYEQSRNLLH
jgi:hypothetical protein